MIRQERTSKGFTLVEIMVVVAIVGLLAALSITSFIRVRINSNEGVAKRDLEAYRAALENYRAAQIPPGFPPDLNTLAQANPPYVDSVLASGVKQGYNFTYTFVNANQYTLLATPRIPNITGVNIYFLNESGVIRFDNANGNPIE